MTRKAILLNDTFTLNKEGEEIDVFSIEEVVNYPNADINNIEVCRRMNNDNRIVGFTFAGNHTDDKAMFMILENDDIKFLE